MSSIFDRSLKPAPAPAPPPPPSAALLEPVSILLVDDDERNLTVLESILDSPDYRLVRAQNADDALHALVVHDFALLVLDVRMPEMNGLELAQLIKQRKKTQHLPIIFLTAYYQEDEHVLQGYGAGAVDYLNKPCNPAVLRSKVAAFVDLYRINRALQEEIAERQRAEEREAARTQEVSELVRQLRALATELTHAEQRERNRLAHILHDHIQQLLVSAHMQLVALEREMSGREETQSAFSEMEAVLKEALDASRSLTVELCPPIVQDAGLAAGLEWLANRMERKNQFKIHLHIAPYTEPPVEQQTFLLFECARELLFNVVKHAGVSEAHVHLSRDGDGRVRMIVRDEGKGFDVEQLRNRNGQTTFGLFSIQQRLMHLGGDMEIDTAPGRGARVCLVSPPAEAAAAAESVEAQPAPASAGPVALRAGKDGAPVSVLIVDDHRIVRQGLAGLLRLEPDIEVVGEAADGTQAMQLAEQLNPDVIIMDLNLGNMNGLQVTRAILGKNPKTKVIALSMLEEAEVGGAVREAGAVAYLNKSVASTELIGTIRAHAGKKTN